MAFFGNLIKSFLSNEGPSPDAVIEVNISNYVRIPICCREDCLVLYGPNSKQQYELLLQKPIGDSLSKAFCLFRVIEWTDAQMRFLALKDTIPPLTTIMPYEIVNQQSLQTLCNLLREHQTWTVAHIAAYQGYSKAFAHQSVARSANTQELELKQTPLHIAIHRGHTDTVRTLLEMNVSVDSTDAKENSIYHIAAPTNKQLIELVCKRESRLLNHPNAAGETPLHVACKSDKPECVKALLCAGADVNVAATHDSTLPIHTAMAANSCQSAKEIITMYPNMLNVQDMKHGGTPLHWATSREMINAMVDLGCQVNARNFHGDTAVHKMVQHSRLSGIITLLGLGAEVNVADNDGNTPLHKATTPGVLQGLLVFGANTHHVNNKDETALHIIATSSLRDKDQMLYILHSIGAPRCKTRLATCTGGCAPNGPFNGKPPDQVQVMSRSRINFDEIMESAMEAATLNNYQGVGFVNQNSLRGGRVLCLDGGGLRGLILIQLLLAIQEAAGGRPVLEMFDWIAGTSTGGILALALSLGKTARYAQGLYFRIKDLVFVGNRPYSEKPLEEVLKKELGEKTLMSDIKGVKVIVTGVLADRFPADLHLFRNYDSPEFMLGATGANAFIPTQLPNEQLVWAAARASGAAPSYFTASGRFIDGGLIANNPTLDVLTEIAEYNTTLMALNRASECVKPQVVVSLGTGRAPVSKVEAIDCFKPESIWGTVQMAFGLSNMAKLLIDQATMADNRTVDRARTWCAMCAIPYLRLNPQLSVDVQLDETNDEILVNTLWETMVYIKEKREQIHKFASLLTRGL